MDTEVLGADVTVRAFGVRLAAIGLRCRLADVIHTGVEGTGYPIITFIVR